MITFQYLPDPLQVIIFKGFWYIHELIWLSEKSHMINTKSVLFNNKEFLKGLLSWTENMLK